MSEWVHLLSYLFDCLPAFWTDVVTTYGNGMDYYATNPGPINDSVLYDQDKHVSAAVWEGQVSFLCSLSSSVLFSKVFKPCNALNCNVNRREVHFDAMSIHQSSTAGYLLRDKSS